MNFFYFSFPGACFGMRNIHQRNNIEGVSFRECDKKTDLLNETGYLVIPANSNEDKSLLAKVKEILFSNTSLTLIVDYIHEEFAYEKDFYDSYFKEFRDRTVYLTGSVIQGYDPGFFYFSFLESIRSNKKYQDNLPYTRFRSYTGRPKPFRVALLYLVSKNLCSSNFLYSLNPLGFSVSEYDFNELYNVFGIDESERESVAEFSKSKKEIDQGDHHRMSVYVPENLNCDFQIYTETGYDNRVFVTEKTYKALHSKRPFIVFTAPGFLKHLRALGFETFGDIIDESYDEILDHSDRLKAVVNEVSRIDSSSEYSSVVNKCKKIAENNYNYLHSNELYTTMAQNLKKTYELYTQVNK